MVAFLVAPFVLAFVAFASMTVIEVRYKARIRPRAVRDPRDTLLHFARSNRATGTDPFARDGALRFERHGAVFRLAASEFGKSGPQTYWLGVGLPDEGSSQASAYRVQRGGGALTQPIDRLPHVVCRLETVVDRFGKRLGLNREPETGDRSFDDAFYVETTARAQAGPILALDSFKSAARECTSLGAALVMNSEGYAVAIRIPRSGSMVDASSLDRALESIVALRRDLPPVRLRTIEGPAGFPVLWFVRTLLLIVIVVAAMAIALELRVIGDGFISLAAKVSMGVFSLIVVALWLSSRGRPRGLARFAVGAALALAGSPSVTAAALIAANRIGDGSSRTVQARFVGKRSSRGRSSTSYYVTLGPWEGQPSGAEIRVDRASFEAACPGAEVELDLGEGRLEFAWVRGWKVLR